MLKQMFELATHNLAQNSVFLGKSKTLEKKQTGHEQYSIRIEQITSKIKHCEKRSEILLVSHACDEHTNVCHPNIRNYSLAGEVQEA